MLQYLAAIEPGFLNNFGSKERLAAALAALLNNGKRPLAQLVLGHGVLLCWRTREPGGQNQMDRLCQCVADRYDAISSV